MGFNLWFVLIGVLLIVAVVSRSFFQRLYLSTTLFYLGGGVVLGPYGFGLITLDPVEGSWFLERLTEIAVIISLFTAGLKLSPPLRDPRWRAPLRLACGSMALTVGLIALVGVIGLDMDLGSAILLGAILAPTDPVLASDVQVVDPGDSDRLRFGLTGEAGLNDGAAFPFVMLGLGLLGLHELGPFGWRWLAVDVLWATLAGLAVGGLLGYLIGWLVVYLRAHHKEAVGMDEFLALGLIALSYGVALLIHSYGFLAVFTAGLALRRIERQFAKEGAAHEVELAGFEARSDDIATRPDTAPASMTCAVLSFNEKAEHIGEFIVLLFVGAVLSPAYFTWHSLWLIPVLFFIIRPLSVRIGLLGSRTSRVQRNLIGWFGIRGLGSIYYLSYAAQHGLPFEVAEPLTAIVLTVVASSVVIHGLSAPPLMQRYQQTGFKR